jgi:hypothetical protein
MCGQILSGRGTVAPRTAGAGTYFMLSNPGFGCSQVMVPAYPQFKMPKATRDYDALEVRLRRRFASRWSAEVDYTYSRLWGNCSGLASSDEVLRGTNNVGRVAPNISVYYDTIYQSYDDKQQQVFGRLATDRPHVVKLWATYDTPWGIFERPWDPYQVVAALRAQGAQIRDDVWYKAPNVYQPRREMRLSAKFSF